MLIKFPETKTTTQKEEGILHKYEEEVSKEYCCNSFNSDIKPTHYDSSIEHELLRQMNLTWIADLTSNKYPQCEKTFEKHIATTLQWHIHTNTSLNCATHEETPQTRKI